MNKEVNIFSLPQSTNVDTFAAEENEFKWWKNSFCANKYSQNKWTPLTGVWTLAERERELRIIRRGVDTSDKLGEGVLTCNHMLHKYTYFYLWASGINTHVFYSSGSQPFSPFVAQNWKPTYPIVRR